MLEKIFHNIIIYGTIISVCFFPILLFLNKNKYKYNFKSIYKIFVFILVILILPINIIKLSKIKRITKQEVISKENVVYDIPEIKFEKDNIIIEIDDSINIKNDIFFEISNVVPYIWVSVTIIIFLYNIINYLIFLQKQKKHYINYNNSKIDEIMCKICLEMKMRKVDYIISDNISTPMTIGLFYKKIIFSKKVLKKKEYEFIIKHELFHIKNKDIEYKFLLLILKSIYWFNPIIYMFANQVDEILELNCDEYVLQGEEKNCRIEYAQVLLNQIESNRNKQYKFSINFSNRRESIMKRFSNIVDKSNKKSIISLVMVLAILLVVAISITICIPNINFATIEENNTQNKLIDKESNNLVNNIKNEITNSSVNNIMNNSENNTINEQIINNELGHPVKGKMIIFSDFGTVYNSMYDPKERVNHTGIDIKADSGEDILACASGIVVYSGYKGAYGKLVIIDHGNGISTWYAHCSKLYVESGQSVDKGDVISAAGSTGNSTGPHLHLEVRKDHTVKNPLDYIKN